MAIRISSKMLRILLFLSILSVIFLCPADAQTQPKDSATTWQLWEHTLTSRKSYSEPYKDLTLTTVFTGPGGQSFSVPGFWVSGNTFKIRCAFPATGTWKWETSCADSGNKSLHRQTGEVTVSAYTGNNFLYRHGYLRVSDSKRHLAYQDGSPFLWMGDTGWMALGRSSPQEWESYVDDRADKGFTVIQCHATQFSAQDTTITKTEPLKAGKPNAEYFKDLEYKIAYANQKGIVIMLVGLGVSGKGHYIAEMNTREFLRYLTGRLAGHAVILSPSMDAPYDEKNDQMAATLKSVSEIHLITQHVGTVAGAAAEYHTKPSIDFTALQSGHHNGNLPKVYEAAMNWTLDLWNMEPMKPVINTEAMYDGRGNNEGNDWREQDARKLGWISWLSGSLGYTYGAGETGRHVTGSHGGLFMFVKDSIQVDYWRKVLFWPSGMQMEYLKKFFAKLAWWELEPAPKSILNQAKSPLKMMSLARSPAGNLLVAYLPDNHDIKIKLTGLQSGLQGSWYDPVGDRYLPLKQVIGDNGEQTFSAPGAGDWVLLLTKP